MKWATLRQVSSFAASDISVELSDCLAGQVGDHRRRILRQVWHQTCRSGNLRQLTSPLPSSQSPRPACGSARCPWGNDRGCQAGHALWDAAPRRAAGRSISVRTSVRGFKRQGSSFAFRTGSMPVLAMQNVTASRIRFATRASSRPGAQPLSAPAALRPQHHSAADRQPVVRHR